MKLSTLFKYSSLAIAFSLMGSVSVSALTIRFRPTGSSGANSFTAAGNVITLQDIQNTLASTPPAIDWEARQPGVPNPNPNAANVEVVKRDANGNILVTDLELDNTTIGQDLIINIFDQFSTGPKGAGAKVGIKTTAQGSVQMDDSELTLFSYVGNSGGFPGNNDRRTPEVKKSGDSGQFNLVSQGLVTTSGSHQHTFGTEIFLDNKGRGDFVFTLPNSLKIEQVPEPLTLFGTGTAAGFGILFKRKLKQK